MSLRYDYGVGSSYGYMWFNSIDHRNRPLGVHQIELDLADLSILLASFIMGLSFHKASMDV